MEFNIDGLDIRAFFNGSMNENEQLNTSLSRLTSGSAFLADFYVQDWDLNFLNIDLHSVSKPMSDREKALSNIKEGVDKSLDSLEIAMDILE